MRIYTEFTKLKTDFKSNSILFNVLNNYDYKIKKLDTSNIISYLIFLYFLQVRNYFNDYIFLRFYLKNLLLLILLKSVDYIFNNLYFKM